MKRYIRTTSIMTNLEDHILEVFGSNNPGYGCSFIARSGKFVNIYPKLDVHEDLCEWVEDNLGIDIPDPDAATFIRKFGWIRLRSDPSDAVVEVPASGITSAQYYALEDWLLFCEDRYGQRDVEISIETDDWIRSTSGNFSEDFAEDILKCIKSLF